jgi:type VI secretion system protein ImpH
MEDMGADDRLATSTLVERLADEPHRFEFHQAVRLLEQFAERGCLEAFYRRVDERKAIARGSARALPDFSESSARTLPDKAFPDKKHGPVGTIAVGEARNPQHEVVSFRPTHDLTFPASDLVDWELPLAEPGMQAGAGPLHLVVAFMGLAGSSGPLPQPFTELIQQRVAAGDRTMRDFLEIFNHRLISMLYRARKKHRIALAPRLPQAQDDGLARLLSASMGMQQAPASSEPRHARPCRQAWRPPLRYAGLLAPHTRSMAGLEALIVDYFDLRDPVHGKQLLRGKQLLGRWLPIDERDTTVVSASAGRNRRLGIDTVVGGKLWDQMGRIELSIGPLPLRRLEDFLPGGKALVPLNELIRFYLKQDLEVDIVLSLDKGQLADTRLREHRRERLGRTAWMRDRLSRPQDDPVRLRLPALSSIRKFDDRNGRFELRAQRSWLRGRLLIGLHGDSAQDVSHWLEHSFIGADSEIASLRERSLLGATRRRIEGAEETGLRVLPGSTLFEIAYDANLRDFVHPERPIVIHNPQADGARGRPSEILLYLRA